MTTPINARDLLLQQTVPRILNIASNFISLVSPNLEASHGADNLPKPSLIEITAILQGVLKGQVAFELVGLLPNTNLVLDPQNPNKLLLDPNTFATDIVTVTAKLNFEGVEYTSVPVTAYRTYSSIVTRLSRAFDVVQTDVNGNSYTLPALNFLELYNGTNKFTTGVVFGPTTQTKSGLTCTVNATTGEVSITQATDNAWTSDYETFTLTATRNFVAYTFNYTITKQREGGTGIDSTPPPTPTNFQATAAINTILVGHDTPTYTQGSGHAKTILYGKVFNQGDTITPFNPDEIIAEFTGSIYTLPSEPGTTWRLWAKWQSSDGFLSTVPAGGTNGISVTTGQDVGKLLEVLTGELTENQLYSTLTNRINLIDNPTTGLVKKTDDLIDIYGNTASAAASATSAAQASAEAIIAQGLAENSASTATTQAGLATTAKNAAGVSENNASVSESSAATSAVNAAGSASTATTQAGLATTAKNAAGVSENNASVSESSAATSAVNAAGSASTATTQAGLATTAKNAAGVSENNASVSESSAATSAVNAAGSASTATTQAGLATTAKNAAGVSETNASVSESSAATSAVNAAGSASTATTQAGLATTAKNAAGVSETNASVSESSAATSAVNAAGSASTATTQAELATTAKNAAGVSETNASVSESSAATSAVNAAGSASSAASTLELVQASNATASAAVQTLATTVAGPDGATAQFTVKTDVNGNVAGFGLSNTANTAGETTSEFIIVADKFAIAPVNTSNTAEDGSPFFHRTVPTTINGVTVPAGTYMKSAFIHDASITTAKIADLAVDTAQIADLAVDDAKISSINASKINAGFISADIIQAGSIDAKLVSIDAAVIKTGFINTARIADATITNAQIGGVLQSVDYGQRTLISRRAPTDDIIDPDDIVEFTGSFSSTATGPATPTPGFAAMEVIGLPYSSSAKLNFAEFGQAAFLPFFGFFYNDNYNKALYASLGGNVIIVETNPTKATRARMEWAVYNSVYTSFKVFLGDTQVGQTWYFTEDEVSQTWAVRPQLNFLFTRYVSAEISFGATKATMAAQTYTLENCFQSLTGWRIDKQGNLDIFNGEINASAINAGEITADFIRSKSATEFSTHQLSCPNATPTSFSFSMLRRGFVSLICSVAFNRSGSSFDTSVSGSVGSIGLTSVSSINSVVSGTTVTIIGGGALDVGTHLFTVTAATTGATAPHGASVILFRSYR